MDGLAADQKRSDELFDKEDLVACLQLRQDILKRVLASESSSVSDKIEAHIAVAKVYATSVHHIKGYIFFFFFFFFFFLRSLLISVCLSCC
jgi:hypothetical protein